MFNSLCQIAAQRISQLQNFIDQLQHTRSVEHLSGRLRINVDHGKVKYYLRDKSSSSGDKYLRKKEMPFIMALAQQHYDDDALLLAEKEKHYLSDFISRYPSQIAEDLYNSYHIERKKLVTPIELPDDEYISKWLSQDYQRKNFSSYDLSQYFTNKGVRVRSKSEIIIANTLDRYDIPYLIELPLYLEGLGTVYPDFTIMQVRSRNIFIWEHHGLLDDRDYRENNFLAKNNAYLKNGYFPGINMIQTFESAKHPLDIPAVEAIINQYFL